MDLNVPVRVFGFELEPNFFETFVFTAIFLSGGVPVGSITREVDGFAGARLFVAEIECTCPAINQVIVASLDTFAIAQVRYLVDCLPECTVRRIPFSGTIPLPTICPVTLNGTPSINVCADLNCTVGQCETEVIIELCPNEPGIPCVVTLDTVKFTGFAEVLGSIPIRSAACGRSVLDTDLFFSKRVAVSQTCFACAASNFNCDTVDRCALLTPQVTATQFVGDELLITGFIDFSCGSI
ncbi:hypothetical protein SAMN04488168_11024 [Bacillus sp. 491mf]|uniref:hypothetical protein n=1 Tax=Bacillus sp. 491mf TaxID=1761755 RepID=UPI0008E3C46E|nr:hypothetical protein [Bacillus sp. 491mf]SFC81980.1 hypothetical protein SAMN04488168_11024 [Bacillus sp. 491mf]